MNDIQDLIEEARRVSERKTLLHFESNDAKLFDLLADALETLNRENEELLRKYNDDTDELVRRRVPRSEVINLQAQLDSMTTEWGHTLWGDVFPCDDEATARIAESLKPRGHVVSRQVMPWVEVSS